MATDPGEPKALMNHLTDPLQSSIRILLLAALIGSLAACQTAPTSPGTTLRDSPSAPAEVSPSGDLTNGANGPSTTSTF